MANNTTVTTRKRNLVAKDLRTPKYRMRVEVSAKKYDRKKLKKEILFETERI
jgi:hypothetical protein